ncbi:MAG: (2Fe-2S) ferredoxin domain-containing protein [Caldisericia bacterium]
MKLEDLRKIREKVKEEMRLREGKARVKIVIGMGTSGIAAGARETLKTFLEEIEKRNLKDVIITQTGERGLASKEPVVVIEETDKPKIIYGDVTPEVAKRIIVEHIINGIPVSEYVISTEK